jgi:hypothetical protein
MAFGSVFEPDLPRRLDEGEKVTFYVSETAVVGEIRRQREIPNRVLVKDNAGHTHKRRIPGTYLKRLKRLAQ